MTGPNRARTLCLMVLVLAHHSITAQGARVPGARVLKSNSTRVDVREGDRRMKGVWTIAPEVALNVYDAQRVAGARTVTFITDVDSLSVDVRPGHTYPFVVLLNGKDTCRSHISTMMQSYRRDSQGPRVGSPTIPITIGGGKLHLRGKVNGSQALDLIFDTGADVDVLYPSAMEKGATLTFDRTTNNVGTGGATVRRISSDNRLEIAGLRWDHESMLYVEKQADAADGIVSYRVFEDKVVEIDYDRMVMILHDTVPAHAAGFAKAALPFVDSRRGVEVGLLIGATEVSGLLIMDTGSDGTVVANQAFATTHGLPGTMEKVGDSKSGGVGSGTIRNVVVLAPELEIAGLKLLNVPIHLELPSDHDSGPPGGMLGMEVLKRFNTIIDYPRGNAYFRPNALVAVPFTPADRGPRTAAMIGIAVISIAMLAVLALLGAKVARRASADVSN